MAISARWERCIEHRGNRVEKFVREYFPDSTGRIGLIAAAGFDARSCVIAELVSRFAKNVDAIYVREERPAPDPSLVAPAETNQAKLQQYIPNHEVVRIEIFGEGNAVVGGRNIVAKLSELQKSTVARWTDVVIDTSAFSVGTSFPVVKYFLEQAARGAPRNVHVMLATGSASDQAIVPIASDFMTLAHGFSGRLSLYEANRAAKLWLPQLAFGRKAMLATIYSAINPDDVCPILPFPAQDPRTADRLVEHYLSEFESGWEVDARDIVYAAENDPKDLYRTLLRLHQLRAEVFESIGGSVMVISPIGSRAMALGTLMAAYELDLTVAYVEAQGFDSTTMPPAPDGSELLHLWLAGDAYTNAT